jgi:hypothetical protein
MKFIILLVSHRSVQMRLYSMHKREFVMVFLAFFACFGLGVFIGLAGKKIKIIIIIIIIIIQGTS